MAHRILPREAALASQTSLRAAGFLFRGCRIEACMQLMRCGLASVVVLTLASLAFAGTQGSFRGKVVETDDSASQPGWLYVLGRNGSIRRVEISRARVSYSEEVPAAQRKPKPREDLVAGTEVRVTADQGSDGEWRATVVEILNTGEHEKKAVGAGKS